VNRFFKRDREPDETSETYPKLNISKLPIEE
jgi:hypothetical protein